MKKVVRISILAFSGLRMIPHILYWMLFLGKTRKALIRADLERWGKVLFARPKPLPLHVIFLEAMTYHPEFRNLLYYRIGKAGKLLGLFCRPMATLSLSAGSIGPGLFIQHGIATIVTARSIGANCWINQQVTIGYANKGDCPIIGDNVTISAGAKVLGPVSVGHHSIVGANAVVVKHVPPNVTVVGVPAYIVRRDGVKTREDL